ncbi:MAG: hypothetical protein AAF184_23870 [Pseudomonadota bacterium]
MKAVLALVGAIVAFYWAYNYVNDVPRWRLNGCYRIDQSFYPGENAEWQRAHFAFEVTADREFYFYERLKDGAVRTTREGMVHFYRDTAPHLFSIEIDARHPLVDPHPSHYRGRLRFYFVFESAFGNMFWRKVWTTNRQRVLARRAYYASPSVHM